MSIMKIGLSERLKWILVRLTKLYLIFKDIVVVLKDVVYDIQIVEGRIT